MSVVLKLSFYSFAKQYALFHINFHHNLWTFILLFFVQKIINKVVINEQINYV